MIVVWHRADLRTHDHPALEAAVRAGGGVLPLFVLDPSLLNPPYTGQPRVAFLHANLRALDGGYRRLGSGLLVGRGDPGEVVPEVARAAGARLVLALRSYEPVGRARDERVRTRLEAAGVEFRLLEGDTVFEPGRVRPDSGRPYQVFTHFWKAWSKLVPPDPTPAPRGLPDWQAGLPGGGPLEGVPVPEPGSPVRLPAAGEGAAVARLERFIRGVGLDYDRQRNLPALDGTSRASPYLHLGVLSPRLALALATEAGLTAWARELAWRDFFRHLLWDEPRVVGEPYKTNWIGFPWRDPADPEVAADLERWATGRTGYPLVDAGMGQMREEGWMNNRARLVVGSFLTKHLLISPFVGTNAFNTGLIDGDEATNNGNWQWVAGCGVDAAPYFRVFNPVAQGETFDPGGEYIARYLPELAGLEPKNRHRPWEMTRPPAGYPGPVVPLAQGRDRFLVAARAFLKGDGEGGAIKEA